MIIIHAANHLQERVDVKQQNGKVALRAQEPSGHLATRTLYGSAVAPWTMANLENESFSQTFTNPQPGVWQLWLANDAEVTAPASMKPIPAPERPRLLLPCDCALTVTALGVKPRAETHTVSSSETVSIEFENQLASIKARASVIGLGSAREDAPVLKAGFTQKLYDVDIPAGTIKLEVDVEADAPAAHVSVLVFYPPKGEEEPWKNPPYYRDYTALVVYDINPGPTKHLEVKTPRPGRYVIALDPVGVPKEGLRVTYRDTFYHPVFGTVTCNDTAAELKTGETRITMLSFDVRARPESGRHLVAQVGLMSDEVVTMSFDAPAGAKPTDPPKVSTEPVPIGLYVLTVK